MPSLSRAIYGCSGTELTADERDFFRNARPWGFILFARNVRDRDQVRGLVQSMREIIPAAPVLVDQEGGRVARLKPPQWRARPPARRFGELYATQPEEAREAAYLNARLIAHDLIEVGIGVDCVPVLDVPGDGASDVIGDRAFSTEPAAVIDLGRAVMEGMLEGGVLPVMKHIDRKSTRLNSSHIPLSRMPS